MSDGLPNMRLTCHTRDIGFQECHQLKQNVGAAAPFICLAFSLTTFLSQRSCTSLAQQRMFVKAVQGGQQSCKGCSVASTISKNASERVYVSLRQSVIPAQPWKHVKRKGDATKETLQDAIEQMALQKIRSFPALSKLGLGNHSIGREACARVVHCIQPGVISEVSHRQVLKCTSGR